MTEGTGYQLPKYAFVEPPELATGEHKRHTVVMVGGSMTDLTLACALAQYGVRALLLDEDNTVGVKGRRHAVHFALGARPRSPPKKAMTAGACRRAF